MERSEVYKKIDAEREYQIKRWTSDIGEDQIPDSEKQPAEWLNYIEFCLNEAKRANYYLEKQETLANVRKIAALAVACLEVNGCPDR